MKKFLILYRSSVSARDQQTAMTPAQARAGMEAWGAWAHRCGPALVEMGAPLAEPVAVAAAPVRATPADHVRGYSMVQAETAELARRLFEGHPHLQAPGASIELCELAPMPG
jgi:hypothetical protein